MAIIYGKNTAVDYAAGNLASFGKSYSRMGAAPLDMYEVWYDYNKLVEYASFRGNDANGNPVYDGNTEVVDTSAVTSYVGQKVAYVNETEGKIYHYSIELNGSLKEIGTSPIGDNKSIVVAADGTVSLKGVDALVFEREVDVLDEEGHPTGEKRTENVQFQPLMTKDGLIWVEPSKTTVEGLASLIDGLTVRVSALENDRVTEQELVDAVAALEGKIDAIDFVDEDELAAAVKVETDRAEAAEKALGERIDAIDFVDADELASALEPYAKTADVNKTLEDYAKTADVNTELAKKADKSAYDQTVLDLEALEARVEAFLDNTGAATEAIDTLQELLTYIEEHDDVELTGILASIQALEEKLVLGTYKDGEEDKEYATVKAYVEAAIEALNLAQYAKASDLSDLSDRVDEVDGKFASYTNTEALTELLAGKQNVIPENTYDAYGAAAAAREGAVADVAAVGYALAADVVDNDTFEEFKTTNSKAIEDAVAAHEAAVAGTYATKAELKATDDVAKDAQNRVGIVEGKIDEITSVGGEPNIIEKIKVNGVTLEVEKDAEGKSTKTVSIAVPTSITTMDGYSDLNTRVTTNTNGIATLESQLANTNTNVSNNATEISKINTEITTGIKPRIEALEGADTVIEGTLAEHTAAIKTINETTIPALSGQISGEVTAREEAIKGINDKIGTVEAGKTVVDMINAVAGTIDFTPYAKKDEVAATYATIAALETVYKVDGESKSGAVVDLVNAEKVRAEAAEKKNADDIAAINTLLNAVDSEDTITSLKELAIWVEAHDTEVIPVVNQHSEDIADLKTRVAANETAVGTTLPAAITQALTDAKAYTDEKMVKADGTSIVNNEGTFSLGAVSTDNLVQGTMTLVLNGGDAKVTA